MRSGACNVSIWVYFYIMKGMTSRQVVPLFIFAVQLEVSWQYGRMAAMIMAAVIMAAMSMAIMSVAASSMAAVGIAVMIMAAMGMAAMSAASLS